MWGLVELTSSIHHSSQYEPRPDGGGGGEHSRSDLRRAAAARHVVALVGAVAVLVAVVAVTEARVDLVLQFVAILINVTVRNADYSISKMQ